MGRAAGYVRSSKDRADISLAAQSRELEKLAAARGLTIARTFEDAVRSGSNTDRSGFQELVAAIKDHARGWSILLVYDTSRIARGRFIAQAFKHEARRHGVEILYAKVPETDPVSAVILDAVFEAMDEVHSIMSREKGLAGMRENVRQGWRAGGRAPWGYRLEHETTGAIRQGRPVLKSRLALGEDAPQARQYLQARARGVPRAVIARQLGVRLAPSTLIGIEWNALVYAGHTVWNRHTAKVDRGAGRAKRRDREAWEIRRDTHPALITDAEAEALLAQLETSNVGAAVSRAKAGLSHYLLSGLLETGDGRRWVAAGPNYRLKPAAGAPGRMVRARELEEAVLQRIRADFQEPDFAAEFAAAVRAHAAAGAPALSLQAEVARLRRQRERAARLAVRDDGDMYVQVVTDLGQQIAALEREASASAAEDQVREELARITPTRVREIFLGMESSTALLQAVSRVVLEPDLTCRIHYGLSVASPRRFGRWAPELVRAVAVSLG